MHFKALSAGSKVVVNMQEKNRALEGPKTEKSKFSAGPFPLEQLEKLRNPDLRYSSQFKSFFLTRTEGLCHCPVRCT